MLLNKFFHGTMLDLALSILAARVHLEVRFITWGYMQLGLQYVSSKVISRSFHCQVDHIRRHINIVFWFWAIWMVPQLATGPMYNFQFLNGMKWTVQLLLPDNPQPVHYLNRQIPVVWSLLLGGWRHQKILWIYCEGVANCSIFWSKKYLVGSREFFGEFFNYKEWEVQTEIPGSIPGGLCSFSRLLGLDFSFFTIEENLVFLPFFLCANSGWRYL